MLNVSFSILTTILTSGVILWVNKIFSAVSVGF